MRTVNLYRPLNGNSPVEEFIDSLRGKQAQKVLWVLQLIEELDVIPRQYFKKLIPFRDTYPAARGVIVLGYESSYPEKS